MVNIKKIRKDKPVNYQTLNRLVVAINLFVDVTNKIEAEIQTIRRRAKDETKYLESKIGLIDNNKANDITTIITKFEEAKETKIEMMEGESHYGY